MKRFYSKFRIILLTLAIGLASVPFFQSLKENLTEIRVDLPQVESTTPIFITPYASQENETVIQDRNLSLYDFGGKILNCDEFEKNEAKICEDDKIKARGFIWNHFKNKKLGYIINIVMCDYSYCEEYFFIEPDENGEWHIPRRLSKPYPWGNQIFETDIQDLELMMDTNDNQHKERRLHFCNQEGMCTFSL